MLGCFSEITKYSLKSRAAKAKLAMARTALQMWPDWIRRINQHLPTDSALSATQGTIVIENGVSGYLDTENFDAILSALKLCGDEHENISGRDIKGLNPLPTARPFRAVLLPQEGSIDATLLHDRISQILRRLGVLFIDDQVSEIIATKGRIRGAKTYSGETLRAKTVVCAAGAFTTKLLESVVEPNSIQPVFSGTGIAMVVDRQLDAGFEFAVRTVNRAGSCGLHILPLTTDRHYIGATNSIFSSPQFEATLGLSHFLLQCAIDQLDQGLAYSKVLEWRIGNRPVSLDTFLLLGWSNVERLYVITGTYRDGIHGSPLIAMIATDELLEGEARFNHPFQATRCPISTMSAKESVAEAVYQATCTGFEASLVLPRLWHHEVVPLLFNEVTRFYELLGSDRGLSPELLPFLTASSLSKAEDRWAFDRVSNFINARGISDDLETSCEYDYG